MKTEKKIMIVLAGPTAVGKTECAIRLAKEFHSEIISADSRQIFKEMSIGTAKPGPDILGRVKHHFIDFISVLDSYNAGQFGSDVDELLYTYYKKNDICILTGGTGLYIKAVLDGLDSFPPVSNDIVQNIKTQWQLNGIAHLQDQLREMDPVYFEKVDKNNPHRLIRAISVCLAAQKPYSFYLSQAKKNLSYTPVFILLNRDRAELYQRINTRVDQMIQQGLLEEVKSLKAFKNCQALQTVGYRELFECMDGLISLDEAFDKIRQNTRNYAKRQLTWFNNDGRYTSFHPDDPDSIITFIKNKMKGTSQ